MAHSVNDGRGPSEDDWSSEGSEGSSKGTNKEVGPGTGQYRPSRTNESRSHRRLPYLSKRDRGPRGTRRPLPSPTRQSYLDLPSWGPLPTPHPFSQLPRPRTSSLIYPDYTRRSPLLGQDPTLRGSVPDPGRPRRPSSVTPEQFRSDRRVEGTSGAPSESETVVRPEGPRGSEPYPV